MVARGRVGVAQNRKIDEEHDEYCIDKVFQLAKVKLERDGEEGREALCMQNCSINFWDEN